MLHFTAIKVKVTHSAVNESPCESLLPLQSMEEQDTEIERVKL